jgi:hypothetical protein
MADELQVYGYSAYVTFAWLPEGLRNVFSFGMQFALYST